MKTSRKAPPKKKLPKNIERQLLPGFLLVVLAVVIIICFHPLTDYFFAQDDFTLIFNSTYDSASHFLSFLDSSPGQFRPLTKSLYFTIMSNLFGLNPFPYHVVSILFHILNTLLFYKLLRRMGIASLPALTTTALFGLSVAFLNVIAWISCIQQLLGLFFMLLALLLGIEALEKRNMRSMLLSSLAYLLALMSLEQTYGVPLILILYGYSCSLTSTGINKPWRSITRTAIPHLVLLGLYMIFMLIWKHIPEGGPYEFHFGTNILANLFTYFDRVFHFSTVFPFVSSKADSGLTVFHLFIFALIIYNIARGRARQVLFALSFFLLTIFPLLFLKDHAFHNHLYVPAFGMLYLLALAIQDLTDMLSAWNQRYTGYSTAVFIILLSLMCYTIVRVNERNFVRQDFPLPQNFVFRRAIIAKNTYDDIKRKTSWHPQNGTLYMISTGNVTSWYGTNVISSLGKGDALKLFFNDPELDVFFLSRGDTIQHYDPTRSLALIFDDMGYCYTEQEVREQLQRPALEQLQAK
ncbi:MAG: hypothetical protein GTO42_02405 [Candidatus Latescibacteria bacterium]|nr:hypothetical protein [Candidatus Latescibacterota bacterium]NIO00988.1 hypothetical protein [Candidatus Latescibacterota bacterium]NIO27387.1 hypothetical protein [Candidatus Latescibacterota bacterium]NIO54909.1 hypothetical protein [Candidatus Latescibacterota bacterium]NIT00998.1 hypothetical protein [Candidatus Latescibacterota bacterium]